MQTFYYKAFDSTNHKRAGTVEAYDGHEADQALRRKGLKPYFLHEVKELRRILKRKKRRRQIIVIGGALSIALALVTSGMLVGYAGRERATNASAFQQDESAFKRSKLITADSDESYAFAEELLATWNNFVPETVVGMEVNSVLLTVNVNRRIRGFQKEDIELLATQSVKAMQRRLNTSSSTILVVRGTSTIVEIDYLPLTKTVRVKFYN